MLHDRRREAAGTARCSRAPAAPIILQVKKLAILGLRIARKMARGEMEGGGLVKLSVDSPCIIRFVATLQALPSCARRSTDFATLRNAGSWASCSYLRHLWRHACATKSVRSCKTKRRCRSTPSCWLPTTASSGLLSVPARQPSTHPSTPPLNAVTRPRVSSTPAAASAQAGGRRQGWEREPAAGLGGRPGSRAGARECLDRSGG